MTNREYLSQNPEEMHGMLKKARDYVERVHGTHERLIMSDDELLDKWLRAEYHPDTSATERHETTYIVNLALTIHHADGMNRDEAEQIGKVAAKILSDLTERFPSLNGIENVTTERVKVFVWG